ncbi:MAG: MFS transporter [Solirubrobacterales bacterium]|nr:MFS transporter [Solirubrobacterales bacterium]
MSPASGPATSRSTIGAERSLPLGPLLGGCTVGLSISWNIANTGPVSPLLSAHYGVGLAVIGLLTAVMFFVELPMMVPGGRAIDRFGAKWVGLVAIGISLAGNLLLLAIADPYLALAARAFIGAGVGLGFLAGAIYAQSESVRGSVLASGIYGGASLSGGGLALVIVPQLVGAFGWRAPFVSAAVVAAVAVPLVMACPSTQGRVVGGRPRFATLLADGTLIRLGAVSAVSFGFSVIIGNWVVTLLERHAGLSRGAAGAVGSLILLLGIVSRPAGGMLARARSATTWRAVAVSFLVGALGTALLSASVSVPLDVLGTALVGMAVGIPFGATVAGAARVYPNASGAAVGAMNSYPVLAIVAGTPLVGLTFSMPGDGRIGFAALAILWAGAVAVIPYRLRLE